MSIRAYAYYVGNVSFNDFRKDIFPVEEDENYIESKFQRLHNDPTFPLSLDKNTYKLLVEAVAKRYPNA